MSRRFWPRQAVAALLRSLFGHAYPLADGALLVQAGMARTLRAVMAGMEEKDGAAIQ